MKTVTVGKIDATNPNLSAYEKTIKFWDNEGNFNKESKQPFYAIYLNDMFLAASTMYFDREASVVNVSLINGSNTNYDMLEQEATKQLTDIACSEYGKDINVNYVKSLKR